MNYLYLPYHGVHVQNFTSIDIKSKEELRVMKKKNCTCSAPLITLYLELYYVDYSIAACVEGVALSNHKGWLDL